MPRIFASLAVANLLLFSLAAGLGMYAAEAGTHRHVLVAVLGGLCSCLTQVLGFTYLTVTGKVMTQAVHLGNLDRAALIEAKGLKRRFIRALPLAILSLLAAVATGAAALRGLGSGNHAIASLVLFPVHAWAFTLQYQVIARNAVLLARSLEGYEAARPPAARTQEGVAPASDLQGTPKTG